MKNYFTYEESKYYEAQHQLSFDVTRTYIRK